MPHHPTPGDRPDPDQLMFRKVKREWSADTLLKQKGWFPLSDVMKVLDPHETGCHRRIINQRDRLMEIGRDPIPIMGLRLYGSRIWADMPVFGRWFLDNETMLMDRTPPGWRFPEQPLENSRGAEHPNLDTWPEKPLS